METSVQLLSQTTIQKKESPSSILAKQKIRANQKRLRNYTEFKLHKGLKHGFAYKFQAACSHLHALLLLSIVTVARGSQCRGAWSRWVGDSRLQCPIKCKLLARCFATKTSQILKSFAAESNNFLHLVPLLVHKVASIKKFMKSQMNWSAVLSRCLRRNAQLIYRTRCPKRTQILRIFQLRSKNLWLTENAFVTKRISSLSKKQNQRNSMRTSRNLSWTKNAQLTNVLNCLSQKQNLKNLNLKCKNRSQKLNVRLINFPCNVQKRYSQRCTGIKLNSTS